MSMVDVMERARRFLSRHAVDAYFVLVVLVSWGAFLAILGPGAFDATPAQLQAMLMPAILAMLLGPSLVSIGLTLAIDGREGLRELIGRLRDWRARPASHVVAVIVGPGCRAQLGFACWPFAPKGASPFSRSHAGGR